MKNRFSTIFTVMLVLALIVGAVCIGAVKGYQEERKELLIACMERHSAAGGNLAPSMEECEADAADFDARLKYKSLGKVAAAFGVEPVTNSITALHAQLVHQQTAEQSAPNLMEQLGEQVDELLEDNIDTKLSISKLFWTVVCLYTIFGKKGRRRGFTFGKLLAGFALFNMWKKK